MQNLLLVHLRQRRKKPHKMDTLPNKELRLWCDVFVDKYRKTASRLALTDYVQQQLLIVMNLCIAKSRIIKNVKHFKLHGTKSLIHKGKTIKVIRKRKQAH